MLDNKKIGARLKELREHHHGWQMWILGKALGYSEPSISAYETGARPLSMQALILYADFFHVSTDYILCRTDVK